MEQTPPIEWPTVEVDGTVFKIHYGLGVQYLASKAGIDLNAFANAATSFAGVIDLFAVIAKPQLEALAKPVLSGEQWASTIGNLGKYKEIAEALGRAFVLSKVLPTETGPTPNLAADTGQRPN